MNCSQCFLLLAIATCCLVACQKDYAKIALEAEKPEERKEAIKKLSDQALLVKISLEDKDESVRKAAFAKLSAPSDLEQVLMKTWDTEIFKGALDQINDQGQLERILLTKEVVAWKKGEIINKPTSTDTLVKLAFEEEDMIFSFSLLNKMLQPELMAKIKAQNRDYRSRLFVIIVEGFDEVPGEERVRLIWRVMPGFRLLITPGVLSLTGEVLSVKTSWRKMSEYYTGGWDRRGDKPGEEFSLSIHLQKIKQPIICKWETKFNYGEFDLGFKCAEVEWKDLLRRVFANLPVSALTELVQERENDDSARLIATEFLTDQAVLARIAKEDEDSSIREEATGKLTAQSPLEDIAVQDADADVRLAATKKLTDQALLAIIATRDRDGRVRRAAVDLLTIQNVLAQVAQTDEESFVRSVAVRKLTDQTLLEKIIQQEKDEDVLGAARYQLDNLRISGNGE